MTYWKLFSALFILCGFLLRGWAHDTPGTPIPNSTPYSGSASTQCSQFETSNAFSTGAATIVSQANSTVNNIPLKTVPFAEFNCSSGFQVMCYATTSNVNFNTCINQAGATRSATPSSTPNAICQLFLGATTLTQVGEVRGWYSNCS